MVKLVDTKDLKSLPLCGVPVRVWPRAPKLIMKNIKIISDTNSKSLKIKSLLIKKLNQNIIKKTNIVIVIGGDGFMLQTLKKNKNSKNFFYGINSGNYGFLMNKFSLKNIIKNLVKPKVITISPLEMTVKNNTNQTKKFLAINEVSILRQSRRRLCQLIMAQRNLLENLFQMVCSYLHPGSTAYNLSVHGPILSLNSKNYPFHQLVHLDLEDGKVKLLMII